METREVQEKRRTVSFAASAEGTKVVFSESYKYYHFRNDGGGTVYVSAYPDVGEGVDGTKSIADGGCGYVFSCDDHVFVKGAAKITVEASNLPECPFKSAQRGGDITLEGGAIELYSGALSSDSSSPTVFEADLSAYSALIICTKSESSTAVQYCPSVVIPTSKLSDSYLEFSLYSYVGSTQRLGKGYIKHEGGTFTAYSYTNNFTEITVYGQLYGKEITPTEPIGIDVAAEGNPVQIDGLQGGVPFSEMAVSGKNLLIYPYDFVDGQSYYGVVVTDNGDGGIRINGTAQDDHNSSFYIVSTGKLFFKGNAFLSGGQNDDVRLFFYDGNANIWDTGSGVAVAYADGCSAGVWIRKGTTVDMIIYPQLELGSTPTEYEPPITGRELTVNVSGKNLIPYPYAETTKTVNGITFTDNGDGSIIANGTSTAQTWFAIFNNVTFNRGTYTLSGNQSGGKLKYDTNLIWKDNNGNEHWVVDAGDAITFTLPYQVTVKILLRIYNGITVENIVFCPQLEIGSTATDYEPYHGAEYTITPDSNPYTVPNDIRQLDGLNNISVSEGEISVVGVRKNAAIKRIWDEIDEIKTAIIVSNGETE